MTVAIYTQTGNAERLRTAPRVFAAVAALGCLSVMLIALRLQPSHSGVGTHTAIGFANCDFLARTGLPCPSCGMTTSFSWFARGNLIASLWVQPMGTVLAIITCACFWGGLYVAITGKPVYRLMRLVPHRYYLIPLLSFAILAWGWKMFIHLRGMDGW